jgi:DNA-binding winged helix-turn-helix (wHTH) protein/tetratricopeptide (TPR) repeat protein
MSGDGRRGEFHLADWRVQPSLNQLSTGEKTVHLRPKVMDVLTFLAGHAGQVVAKDEIIEGVWAKKFLADTALSRAIFELREALGDDPHEPVFVETIPKRGYRLVAPVTFAPRDDPGRVLTATARRPRIWRLAGSLGAVSVLLVAGWQLLPSRLVPTTLAWGGRRERVVVLPFESLGPLEDAAFARGLTEELAGRLTALGCAEVLQAPAVGREKSELAVAQALGGDCVLTGTIRWDQSAPGPRRVRVIPRLVRVGGAYEWAQVYDRVIDDPLGSQAEIAATITRHLELVLGVARNASPAAVPATNPDAYEAYLRSQQYQSQLEAPEGQLLAVRLLERAVAADPQFTQAWAALALAHGRLFHFGFDRSDARREKARQAVETLTRLAPNEPLTHAVTARHAYLVELDSERAMREALLAEQGGGPTVLTRSAVASVLRRQGRLQEAHDAFLEALELAPRDSWLSSEVGITCTIMGRWAEADRFLARSSELAPDQHTAYDWRSLNDLLWHGDVGEARRELERMPALDRAPVVMAWWRQEILEGHPEEALKRSRQLSGDLCSLQLELFPRELMEAEALLLMGDVRGAHQGYEAAVRILERERAARPDDPRVPSALGLALAGSGRRVEAIQAGEQGVEAATRQGDTIRAGFALATLARIQLMTGDVDAAARLVVKVLGGPIHPMAAPLIWLDPRWERIRTHPLVQGITLGRPT